jgi:glycerophosphoryl diester phosphodiesterase
MPARPHPFLDWPGPIPFAHRGGASDAPENTMRAFEHAVGLGYRYIETDVHATADGVLVAFHDDDLSRLCGVPGHISELPWATVRTARVDGRDPVPLFEDLLGAWPELRINIDCKTDQAVNGLVAALRRADALDRVCLGSFSERRLTRLRKLLGPGLCSSLGTRAAAALRAGLPVRTGHCAQVPLRHGRLPVVDRPFLAAAHRQGLQVHVWTIDAAEEMERLLDLGVDGLMTDRPAVLRGVLERRGQWTQ